MKWSTERPTTHGYYWLKVFTTNLATKERMISQVEIANVFFQVPHRKKKIDLVQCKHWQCRLDQMAPDTEWAGPILPPE